MKVSPQIKVALGTVELCDTDRRAIAWDYEGAFDDSKPKQWVLDTSKPARIATRAECRTYLLRNGTTGVNRVVRDYLEAGGLTASMEANKQTHPYKGTRGRFCETCLGEMDAPQHKQTGAQ